jgi:hypothetical protein
MDHHHQEAVGVLKPAQPTSTQTTYCQRRQCTTTSARSTVTAVFTILKRKMCFHGLAHRGVSYAYPQKKAMPALQADILTAPV